jgi:putative pyruvate formate lyase activating enzyme
VKSYVIRSLIIKLKILLFINELSFFTLTLKPERGIIMSGKISITADIFDNEDQKLLRNCTLCPRECNVNRFEGAYGFCRADAGLNIASICIHKGEEPPVSGPHGICNIFFTGCNLKCLYCQNYDISRPGSGNRQQSMDLETALDIIEEVLSKDIKAVGFVSPSHVVPQVKALIRGLNSRGLKPVTVYNTNGYDKPETLRGIGELIDVWLPDYKYASEETASHYSDAGDYPEVALKALKEMYYQQGSSFLTDDAGQVERGILLRHLVLPGSVEESKNVLRKIAEELSTGIHLSLMSQYHPISHVKSHPILGRPLFKEEYASVVMEMEKLGFRNGWVQDMDSYENFQPDFSKEHPFED